MGFKLSLVPSWDRSFDVLRRARTSFIGAGSAAAVRHPPYILKGLGFNINYCDREHRASRGASARYCLLMAHKLTEVFDGHRPFLSFSRLTMLLSLAGDARNPRRGSPR